MKKGKNRIKEERVRIIVGSIVNCICKIMKSCAG